MLVGHFAVAFAAKPAAPRVSLPALIIAAGLADVLWIVVRGTQPHGRAGLLRFLADDPRPDRSLAHEPSR